MNTALIVSLMLCALPAGSMADKPKVTRTMLELVFQALFDHRVRLELADDGRDLWSIRLDDEPGRRATGRMGADRWLHLGRKSAAAELWSRVEEKVG